jgi:hypothetical protein
MSLGGGGGAAAPPQRTLVTEPPKVTDPLVQEAIEKEKALARRRKGRGSTIVTGAQGLPDTVGQKKEALG